MINTMKGSQTKVTDFNVGSVARSMFGAVAAEMNELYLQMFIGLKEAIPVSIFNSFQFNKLPAVSASGVVRVTITAQPNQVVIPAGTVFSYVNGLTSYTNAADAVIPAGNTFADIFVVAQTAGVLGNIPVSTPFMLTPNIAPFVSASNAAALANGADAETDAEQEVRFQAFIQSLQRGTVAAIGYGAGQAIVTDSNGLVLERVFSESVIEPYLADNAQPISLVEVYLHNGSTPASSALIAAANKIIYGYYDANGVAVPGYKAAGVVVNVYPAVEVPVNVTGRITVAAGFDAPTLASAAQGVMSGYLANLKIGQTAIASELVALVMGIEGVVDFNMSAPSGNTTATNKQKVTPGAMTVTY